jgi:hypothetical protein
MRSTPASNNEWPRSPEVSRLDRWPQRRSEGHQYDFNRRPATRPTVPQDRRWRAHLPSARQQQPGRAGPSQPQPARAGPSHEQPARAAGPSRQQPARAAGPSRQQPARATGPSGASTWPRSRSDNSRSRPLRTWNHGRASIATQYSSHDEAVQRPRRVWARQPLLIQRSGPGNLLGDNTRGATNDAGASGLRAHQRHAHFDLGRSDELERMPQHLFSAADACDDSESDQVEQRNFSSSLTRRGSDDGARTTRDNALSMEGRQSTAVNRGHGGRTRYTVQATRTHDSQAEAPRSTSPGLHVKTNAVRQTVQTSSSVVQQQMPHPRQSSLFQFYARKPDKIAGNSSHGNGHKVRQMDGSHLALDVTTAGALPNADTPGLTRRGSGCESLAPDIEVDDGMWDGVGDEYENAEDKPESSALGKRKATAGRVSRCDSGGAQGLKRTKPRVARRGGSASTANGEFRKDIQAKRTRPTQPCQLNEHAQTVIGGRRRKKLRSRKRCQYPDGCAKIAIGRTLFCKAHGGGKRCQYPDGCDKSAIGRTLFCTAHGGGQRCQYPDGCAKSAIGQTKFCLAHGGGKRCQCPEGCGKSAVGATLFCIAHGGGKRCQYPDGCDKGARRSTMFCIAHGGGKRCQYPDGCDKSAIDRTLFCTAHGGGKRCQYPDGCDKSAIGRTLFCVAHGGGKRCQYPEGCGKGAEGRTMFCLAHGGGKRCQYPEGCDKSAIGRTLFCTTHGGGKRCQYPDGCDKSARGSTMFCKAHGGGKRCQYPEGCEMYAKRGGLCRRHGTEAGLYK